MLGVDQSETHGLEGHFAHASSHSNLAPWTPVDAHAWQALRTTVLRHSIQEHICSGVVRLANVSDDGRVRREQHQEVH